MIYTPFALAVAAFAIVLALLADGTSLYLSRRYGGFGFAASPWMWALIAFLWLGLSLLLPLLFPITRRWRPF